MENKIGALYEKRLPIFVRSVKGPFRTFKSMILGLAFSVFFLLPWVPWKRVMGANQAIFFDIVERRYYMFNLVVDIQHIFWLAGFLAIAAFTLFFITSIAGRVFCGYFCFQTLWTDAFIRIETWIQGDRNARIKLHAAPWRIQKCVRMGLTWLAWFLLAFWTGFTFTAYWAYAPQLLTDFFAGHAHPAAYGTTFFLTFVTFVLAGFAREQVCAFMCPYARFQSVMFDKDTLIVAYDHKRGEGIKGRTRLSKGLRSLEERHQAEVGDCVDCDLCVQSCPAGIDIRTGLNYRCISCGLCIDACNTMMNKVGFQTQLIGYRSENSLTDQKTRFWKPRNLGYGLVIVIIASLLIMSILNSDQARFSVERTRVPAFTRLANGDTQNSYSLKMNNLSMAPQVVSVLVNGLEQAELVMKYNHHELKPGAKIVLPVFIRRTAGVHPSTNHSIQFIITVQDLQGVVIETHTLPSTFIDH